jgi:hypothetical protein
MIYQAKVLHLDEDVEEEVVLQVGGVELTCFACVCPYAIEVGLSYMVELHPVVFGDYVVTELIGDTAPAVARVGNSFTYVITGQLSGGSLECGGLIFEDEVLQRDFGDLDGKTIAMTVDRIDVEFLAH